jgi:hypothetical protein
VQGTTKTAVLILLLASFPLGTAEPLISATEPKTSAADVKPAPTPEQVREAAALALIAFPWKELKYDIVFMPPRHGFRAMIFPVKRRIEVYARPGDDSRLLAYDIAHELGHAIDVTRNDRDSRKKWMKSRGINPATPWFGCNRCSDYNTPAGDFAETFALLLLGPGHFAGRIAPSPSEKQVKHLASFFPELRK